LPNRDVALNVSLKKSLEIKEIVENKLKLLLQDLQFTDQDVQMLAVQLYNQARRLFKQNVHNMLDLNTLEYQLHERFNGNYDYSHAQINDVIKSQIMLITMFTHLFHQQS